MVGVSTPEVRTPQIPYRDIQRPPVLLPKCDHDADFSRSAVTTAMYVPEVF